MFPCDPGDDRKDHEKLFNHFVGTKSPSTSLYKLGKEEVDRNATVPGHKASEHWGCDDIYPGTFELNSKKTF